MKKKLILQVGDGAIVAVSHIMQKPYGLVVVGVVTEGKISKGDPVNIPA